MTPTHIRTKLSRCVPLGDLCQSNEYLPPGTNICQLCAYNCISCESHHNCSVCLYPYKLFSDSGLCFLYVPLDAYGDYTLISLISCTINCKICNSSSSCILCIPGFFILEGVCVNICPFVGYYYSPGYINECIKCHISCATCNGGSEYNCTSCAQGVGLLDYSHQCFLFCNLSSYYDITHMVCMGTIYIYYIYIACDSRCERCISANTCTKCRDHYIEINSECVLCSELLPENGFEELEDKSGCREKCGKGQNFGYYECDDSNLLDGDGAHRHVESRKGINVQSNLEQITLIFVILSLFLEIILFRLIRIIKCLLVLLGLFI